MYNQDRKHKYKDPDDDLFTDGTLLFKAKHKNGPWPEEDRPVWCIVDYALDGELTARIVKQSNNENITHKFDIMKWDSSENQWTNQE